MYTFPIKNLDSVGLITKKHHHSVKFATVCQYTLVTLFSCFLADELYNKLKFAAETRINMDTRMHSKIKYVYRGKNDGSP